MAGQPRPRTCLPYRDVRETPGPVTSAGGQRGTAGLVGFIVLLLIAERPSNMLVYLGEGLFVGWLVA